MTAPATGSAGVSASDIAVVGMSCRFPGANTPEAFWKNLRDGKESIRTLSRDELLEQGIDAAIVDSPQYVKAGAFVDGIEMFDPAFFGFTPRDASIMDPQHRLFLECASEVLEHAGYDPQRFPGAIGVFAGCGMNLYLIRNLLNNPRTMDSAGFWLVRHLGNDKDFLTTRASYCLNLKGPSVNIQTACSTSLVAIHFACQSLLNGESDMALAGGVTIEIPHRRGYVYEEGEILSADGHCRAFDHRATGTVLGSGVGLVALRRLADARASGNTIHAVIKASAINNDGAGKVGYFAPSVDGHTHVVLEAMGIADIEPDSISYIEAHGTGTAVGDPIEIKALTEAFRKGTGRKQFCGIGSAKTNIGHLDMAAGVAGFIKVVQALKHQQLPPSLNYETPNPAIDFASSPFFVVDSLRDWVTEGAPRRAGISSLGVGGTNAHVILEEAPVQASDARHRSAQLLVLSARSDAALQTMSRNLAAHLREHPDASLPDAAHTLQVGRRTYNHRQMLVGRNLSDAIEALDSGRVQTHVAGDTAPSVVFMFTGQGAQHIDMGRELYEAEPVFRQELDQCCEMLAAHIPGDFRSILFPASADREASTARLTQTAMAQPALFVIEYALAKLWMSWGIKPHAMIGHSIGEYTAACLAGVFSLEQALGLVATRGRLMQELPPGLMLAISTAEKDLKAMLAGASGVSLAVQNGLSQFVVAGPHGAIEAFEQRLGADFIPFRRLQTSHAFHSSMMDPILDRFTEAVAATSRRTPHTRFVSNVTGTWITEAEVQDPRYWARHLRQTVRFGEGLGTLLSEPGRILLEVGPGKTLATFARQHPGRAKDQVVLQSIPHPKEGTGEVESVLQSLGQLWIHGVDVDWEAFSRSERRARIALPTYPFERQRCWVEPDARPSQTLARPSETVARPSQIVAAEPPASAEKNVDSWFWRPSWSRTPLLDSSVFTPAGRWLVFANESPLAAAFLKHLASESPATSRSECVTLVPGQSGDLAGLKTALCERRRPGPREVEIRVHSAGLNFRDVLNVLGAYPEGPVPLGSECVGTVAAVGSDVTGFKAGDEVMAIGQDTFRTFVTLDANFVVSKPRRLSFEDAATLPVVFMTAHYALNHVARLSKGERVLIHAAAGGVGMAAVRLAQAAGAEIFATAGSAEKRRFLTSLGVKHVFDSRSFDFVDGIMAVTGGQGVDVVLNALAGEFIRKSLSLLRPFGRFLEIGKADIYQDSQLGLEPFKKGLSFNSIDMEIVAKERPELYRRLFEDLAHQFEVGALEPLPSTAFPVEQASTAFAFMAKAKHLGKVVLTFQPQPRTVSVVTAGDRYERLGADRYVIDPDRPGDYARVLDDVNDGASGTLRIVHLWTAGQPSVGPFDRAQSDSFYSLLYLAQGLAERSESPARLMVVSNRSQQVVPGEPLEPIRATLLGPVRVMPRELPHVACRAVDIDDRQCEALDRQTFDWIIAELAAANEGESRTPAVAYRDGNRYEPSLTRIAARDDLPSKLRDGGVYLITGGLGGVGLAIAAHLAKRFKARLVLVGRSAGRSSSSAPTLEQTAVDRTLRQIVKDGGQVLVHAADVTDPEAIKQVVANATDRFGAINGVIHAAGVLEDGVIQLKQPAAAGRVLAPKVSGTLALEAAVKDLPLDFFALFSSTSAHLGLAGQVDYTAANAFLNAFARDRHTRQSPTIALGWGPWLEVGMAARAKRPAASLPKPDPGKATIAHPFLDSCVRQGPDALTYRAAYGLDDCWLLNEHRIEDFGALIPGTGYLELARACLEHAGTETDGAVEIRDVVFASPFRVGASERQELCIDLRREETGYSFRMTSQNGKGRIEHVEGSLKRTTEPASNGESLRQIRERCNVAPKAAASPLNPHFLFGPRWHNLKRLDVGKGEALATLELPAEFHHDLDQVKLHPALLDIATSCFLQSIEGFDPQSAFFVPVSCARVSIYAGLPPIVHSHVRRRPDSNQEQFASFDVSLYDESGRAIVAIEEFTFRKMTRGDLPKPSCLAAGILPADGVEAFERALRAIDSEPELVISPWDLETGPRSDSAVERPAAEPRVHSAPAIVPAAPPATVPSAAAGDEVERGIAEIWQNILGLNQLGVRDNFFQSGADSLSALRATAQIKRAFKTALTISTLYEHPTIEQLAKVINEARASRASDVTV